MANANKTFPFSDITQNDTVSAQGDWVIHHLCLNKSKILPAINVIKIACEEIILSNFNIHLFSLLVFH